MILVRLPAALSGGGISDYIRDMGSGHCVGLVFGRGE